MEKIRENNPTVALMSCMLKKKKIYPAYFSKHNSNRRKQVILLIILNGEGQHYLIVKKLSVLLRGITSKHIGNFYCLDCRHFFRTKSTLGSHKKVCKNIDIWSIVMFFENTKTIIEFNKYQKSDKAPFIFYTDLECLIEKIDGCENNLEKSSTTKVGEYILSGFSMSTKLSSFKSIENKDDGYKKIKLLTNKQQKSYENANICYASKEKS